MDENTNDLLADFLTKRREAQRQCLVDELLKRFELAKGRGPVSVEELRAFIAAELAAARGIKEGDHE